MLTVKPDFYNAIFNQVLNVPDVQTVKIDPAALDLIDPSIVTADNIWNICVLLSMLVTCEDCSILCKDDVDGILYRDNVYAGKLVLDAVKLHLLSAKPGVTVRSTIERAYATTDLYEQFKSDEL